MKTLLARALALFFLVTATVLHAQVPQLINYQGRVTVGAVNFNGSGAFKFALVNSDGTTTYWSNDGTSTTGDEPAAAVALNVAKGLYSVLLGDDSLENMTAVPASVFINPDVRLRVWFDDGVNGSQLLAPDQRIAAVGYAIMAGNVADGAITSAKIADGAVGPAQLYTALAVQGPAIHYYICVNGSFPTGGEPLVANGAPTTGEIRMTANATAATGSFWLPCDGRLLQISQYPALFTLLGITYGGNGTTNFAIPDLRNTVPVASP